MKILFFKKSPTKKQSASNEELEAIINEERKVLEQINNFSKTIEEAPTRLREQHEAHRSILPPPDDWEFRVREQRLQGKLSRGELRNERKYQVRSTFLLLLLLAATVTILSWIYQFVQNHQ